MWEVHVGKTPSALASENKGWDYPSNFFPRKTHYKKDAKLLKTEAEQKGGRDITIQRSATTQVRSKVL